MNSIPVTSDWNPGPQDDQAVPFERSALSDIDNGQHSSISSSLPASSHHNRQLVKARTSELMNSLQAQVLQHTDFLISVLDRPSAMPRTSGHSCHESFTGAEEVLLFHESACSTFRSSSSSRYESAAKTLGPREDDSGLAHEDVRTSVTSDEPFTSCLTSEDAPPKLPMVAEILPEVDTTEPDHSKLFPQINQGSSGETLPDKSDQDADADANRSPSRRLSRISQGSMSRTEVRPSAIHLWSTRKGINAGAEDESEEQTTSGRSFSQRSAGKSGMPADDSFLGRLIAFIQRKYQKAAQQANGASGSFEHDKQEEDEPQKTRRLLKRFVHSVYFNTAAMLLIGVNAIFIGWQTDADMYRYQHWGSSEGSRFEGEFTKIGAFFNVAFAVELVLRIGSDRLAFVVTPDWRWNLMDTVLVITGVFELAVARAAAGNLTFARTLRIIRMVRILRVIRVVRFFDSLRKMVSALLNSMLSLFWLVLLLSLVLFVFAVGFMQAITTDLHAEVDPRDHKYYSFFMDMYGSIPKTMCSLLETISGGTGWYQVMGPVMRISWVYGLATIFFVSFTIFGVMNVVTGIFVDRALYISQVDRNIIIRDEMAKTQSYVEELRRAFHKMDRNGDGTLTREEARTSLDQPSVKALLAVLQLNVSEAGQLEQLCDLLDPEGDGDIDIDDFVQACMRLKGTATSMDLCALLLEVSSLRSRLEEIVDGLEERFNGVTAELEHLAQELSPPAETKRPSFLRQSSSYSLSKKKNGAKAFKLPNLGHEALSQAMALPVGSMR